jgi:hypothetical protein
MNELKAKQDKLEKEAADLKKVTEVAAEKAL